jgi:hypothetical protein
MVWMAVDVVGTGTVRVPALVGMTVGIAVGMGIGGRGVVPVLATVRRRLVMPVAVFVAVLVGKVGPMRVPVIGRAPVFMLVAG